MEYILLDTNLGWMSSSKNYQLANFFPARAVAVGCLYMVLKKRGMLVHNRDRWVDHITSGKVDVEDFEEVLEELAQANQSGT